MGCAHGGAPGVCMIPHQGICVKLRMHRVLRFSAPATKESAGQGRSARTGPSDAPTRIPKTIPKSRYACFRTWIEARDQAWDVGAAGLPWEGPGHRQVQGALQETFHGSARAADEALRDLIDQQAPSRSDGIGATFGQLLD